MTPAFRLASGCAIEILTERFGGIPTDSWNQLASDASPAIRARLAWALGRRADTQADPVLQQLAGEADRQVATAALAALVGRDDVALAP